MTKPPQPNRVTSFVAVQIEGDLSALHCHHRPIISQISTLRISDEVELDEI